MARPEQLSVKIIAYVDRTINLLAYLAGLLVTLTMLAVTAEVVTRKLLNTSIAGVVDFSEHALLYITFLGAAWVLKREGHVKLDMFLNLFSPHTRALCNIAMSILGAILCLAIAVVGTMTTWDLFERGIYTTTIIETPTAALVAIIPIGSFLLFIQFLRRAHGYLGRWKVQSAKEPEAR